MKMFFLFFSVSLLASIPIFAHAQSYFEEFPTATELLEQLYNKNGEGDASGLLNGLISSQNPLTLVSSPSNPKPGEKITITISDYGRPVDSSTIDWYVDGEPFSSGIGIKNISFNAREVGVVNTVYAHVTFALGYEETTAPITVGASYVDILWEAVDAKTPPFYKGKALPSWDTIVKTYIIPEVYSATGVKIPPSTFVYTWEKNQRAIDLNTQSGYGKDSVYVLADFARKQHLVGVNLSNTNAAVTAGNLIAIKLHDPEILLYEKRPLGGVIFERALPDQISQPSTSSTLRIVAYPFGLDSRDQTNVSFTWGLNGRSLSNSGTMYAGEIPLVSNDTNKGVSTISVEATNRKKPLQSAEESVRINVE